MQTSLKVNDEVILDIKRIGINGEGIAYYKKLAVFIPNALPGEGVNVRITRVLDKMAYGEVIEFKHISKDRVEPTCPHYGKCGGCQTLHINYDAMLGYKKDIIVEAISRYTKLNPRSFQINNTIPVLNDGYRFKSSLPIKKIGGVTKVGLIKPGTNVVTTIDSCLNHNKVLNQLNEEICKLIDKCNIEVYDYKLNKGALKYLICRVSHYNLDAQVTLVTVDKKVNLSNLAKEIMKLEHVKSVYVSYNDIDDIFEFGKLKKLEGTDTIVENIGKYKFELAPSTFFQLNPVQTETLYDVIRKACKLSLKETVLDLYCGVGTIGIYLSSFAKKIIGVEQNEVSIENAKTNALLNKVRNSKFIAGNVNDILPKILREETIDVLVCDPPRLGLGEYVCKILNDSNIKRIIYTSCNPATLAKDLNILSKKYNVNSIQPVDMFKNTSHVESITLLVRKDAK